MDSETHASVRVDLLARRLELDGEVLIPCGALTYRIVSLDDWPYVKLSWFQAHDRITKLHPLDWEPEWTSVDTATAQRLAAEELLIALVGYPRFALDSIRRAGR